MVRLLSNACPPCIDLRSGKFKKCRVGATPRRIVTWLRRQNCWYLSLASGGNEAVGPASGIIGAGCRVLRPGGTLVVLDLVQPVTMTGVLAMRALEGITRTLPFPELAQYRWLGRSLLHAATANELSHAISGLLSHEVITSYWLGDLVFLATAERKGAAALAEERGETPPRRTIWASDGSPTAMEAGRWIGEHLAPGTEVHVVTICPPPPPERTVAATDRAAWLRHHAASLSIMPAGKFKVVPVLLDGEPGPELVKYARRIDSELLVLGRKNRSLGARRLLGNISGYVNRTAPCPVLAIDGP